MKQLGEIERQSFVSPSAGAFFSVDPRSKGEAILREGRHTFRGDIDEGALKAQSHAPIAVPPPSGRDPRTRYAHFCKAERGGGGAGEGAGIVAGGLDAVW